MNNQTGIYRGLPDIQFPSYSLKTKCPRSQGTWYHHWVDSSKLGLHTPSQHHTTPLGLTELFLLLLLPLPTLWQLMSVYPLQDA